jgi:hypothetical protein
MSRLSRLLKIGIIVFLCSVAITHFFTNIEEYVQQDEPKILEIKEKLSPLFSKNIKHSGVLEVINRRDVFDEIYMYKGDKSYTINKEKVFLCLKDKNNEYYSMNILIFVTLHELAHVLSTTIGHDKNFNDIFDALLKKAAEMKIYDPSIQMDQNYCT